MSTADHATCCCAETLAEVARLTAERDRARGTAARLEAELARGFRIAAPDITLTRAVDPIARHGCRRSGVVAVSAPE